MFVPSKIGWIAFAFMSALLNVACGGGDGGSTEWSRPGHYQSASQGVAEGPDGETIRLGTERGGGHQEQSPAQEGGGQTTNPLDCEELSTCEQVCVCLGGDPVGCQGTCDAFYENDTTQYDYGGNSDY